MDFQNGGNSHSADDAESKSPTNAAKKLKKSNNEPHPHFKAENSISPTSQSKMSTQQLHQQHTNDKRPNETNDQMNFHDSYTEHSSHSSINNSNTTTTSNNNSSSDHAMSNRESKSIKSEETIATSTTDSRKHQVNDTRQESRPTTSNEEANVGKDPSKSNMPSQSSGPTTSSATTSAASATSMGGNPYGPQLSLSSTIEDVNKYYKPDLAARLTSSLGVNEVNMFYLLERNWGV